MPPNQQDDRSVFYRKPGSMTLNLNNFMFSQHKPTTMPVAMNLQVTPFKNVTVGPMFGYFQFKYNYQESLDRTVWQHTDVKYHQYFVGLRGTYHLLPMIQNFVEKPFAIYYIDLYVSAWGGYSFVGVNYPSRGEQDLIDRQTRFRGGAMLGVRAMIVPRFGFFMEGGYSSYGFASFGMTIRLR